MTIQNTTVFLSILLLSACLTAHALAKPQDPPPSEREYFPEQWEEYTSEKGGFRIRFPGKPRKEFSPVEVNFLSYTGLLEYRVSYVDDPELTRDPDSARHYLRESRDAARVITQISGERIIKEKVVTVEGYPGFFLHVESGKAWIRTQEIVVCKRVYTIIVEGRKRPANKPAEKNDFEKVATAFINSFKLIPSAVCAQQVATTSSAASKAEEESIHSRSASTPRFGGSNR